MRAPQGHSGPWGWGGGWAWESGAPERPRWRVVLGLRPAPFPGVLCRVGAGVISTPCAGIGHEEEGEAERVAQAPEVLEGGFGPTQGWTPTAPPAAPVPRWRGHICLGKASCCSVLTAPRPQPRSLSPTLSKPHMKYFRGQPCGPGPGRRGPAPLPGLAELP